MADETKEGLAGFDESLPVNPFTNPDVRPKSTLQFPVDPMVQTVRDLPGKLLTNADENLTKNIVALTPKPKESRYGSIRMPRMSDDPMNAGNFVMAGPIAVEEALGKFAAKALPAKTIETKLLQMGASKAELETRGVTQYLESQGTRPVHPLEVMKYLDDNPYQLNEVILTNTPHKFPPKEVQDQYNAVYDAAKKKFWSTPYGSPEHETALAAFNKAEADMKFNVPGWGIAEGRGPTKFEGWQTPGGENYREILLQAPVKENGWTPAFTGGHWDEPNVVAHMRVNDRTLPSGEKALHIDEWQSDWATAERNKKWAVLQRGNELVTYPTREGAEKYIKMNPDNPGLSVEPVKGGTSHPLVDNWQDLMARRTLKEAVDGGYDRLTWTTGAQQQDRYDLSKVVDEVTYFPDKKELHLGSMGSEGYNILSDVEPSKISSIIGKEPASKLLQAKVKNTQLASLTTPNENYQTISGLDLKVGGEWANKLYDESMVDRFNKIGKQYGVKVEDVPFKKQGKGYTLEFVSGPPLPISGLPPTPFNTKQDVLEWLNQSYFKDDDEVFTLTNLRENDFKIVPLTGERIHSIKITPEMKESIGKTGFHPFADLPGPRPRP